MVPFPLVVLLSKFISKLKMRGRRVKINEDGDGEVDVNFWAQAAADQANGRREDEDLDEGTYFAIFRLDPCNPNNFNLHGTDGNANVPFNTQFFQDDYDDGPGFDGPGFDDDGDGLPQGVDDDEQDLLASTQKRRRVRPEAVSYAKRAKRVDVRKLKDNIWKGLDIVVPHKKETDNEEKDEDEMVRFTCIPLSYLKTDATMKGR